MEPVADKNNGHGKRARGVQASAAKLRAAQLAAGIKSQAELAKRIQQLEGLDKPPRSLVNRVFSGEQVDLLSLERVARALHIEAWALYLSSDDQQADTLTPQHSITAKTQRAPLLYLSGALTLLLLIIVLYFPASDNKPAQPAATASPALQLERKVITVLPFQGDQTAMLTPALEQVLAIYSSSLPGSASRFASANPLQLLADKQADVVFTGESRQFGRHLAIRLFVYQRHGMQQIWAGTMAASSSVALLQDYFATAISQSQQSYSLPQNPDWQLTQRYTDSLNYFELDRTEQNLLRLVSELSAVIRLDATYTDAHAALCSALIQESILSGAADKLHEAQQACDVAAAQNAEAISVLQAQANLARKQGDTEQAAQLLQQVLAKDSNNVTAKFVLAEVQMLQFRKSGDASYIETAIGLLGEAFASEPDNWKLPYTLGRAYYFSGNVDAAINWSAQAAKIRPEFQTYNNLGTLQFCKGDLVAARQHYLAALHYQPEQEIVLANIATVHYYLEEYQQAIAILQQRLDTLEQKGADQQYNIWMNLANAYRHVGANSEAVLAYQKSLHYIEHAIAKGEANHLQRAIRVAIYLDLALLQPELVSAQLQASLREEALALDAAAEPASLHIMALVWMYLGDMDKAAQLKQRLAGNCPGFVASPDFAPLNTYLSAAHE
ncbi:tetratricopeptide repeat protein [Rheinheimera sp. YQF-2]|uniref:Tetratricopeptide repeat protein n=1 Tax=Rheinheimera lutimaris TaxID=2740584 RepID=A0A7Y5ANR4_9GAMM|nr:tetratricopeptide repeat protein [Rheinheimera lutimaris]NRQ41772.1 tetratricopeptide repeat protein [Rheinheimera lutimaris]